MESVIFLTLLRVHAFLPSTATVYRSVQQIMYYRFSFADDPSMPPTNGSLLKRPQIWTVSTV